MAAAHSPRATIYSAYLNFKLCRSPCSPPPRPAPAPLSSRACLPAQIPSGLANSPVKTQSTGHFCDALRFDTRFHFGLASSRVARAFSARSTVGRALTARCSLLAKLCVALYTLYVDFDQGARDSTFTRFLFLQTLAFS